LTGQTNNQYLTFFGLDFNHEINPPTQWDVNLNLLSSSNLSQFQYGGSYSNTPTGTGTPHPTGIECLSPLPRIGLAVHQPDGCAGRNPTQTICSFRK
jgi:hypothetical protein